MTKRARAGQLFDPGDRMRRRGANTRALGTTVQAMRTGGLLERADEALVTVNRTAAELLDAALADPEESRYTVARLLAEYRATLDMLRALAPSGALSLDDLFAGADDPNL